MVTEVLGGNNHQHIAGGLGEPVIIPIFRQPRRIHLKKVSGEENPFKIFKDLDQILESFLDGFAKGIVDENEHHNHTNKDQKELRDKIDKLDENIKNENIVVTNIRDITNEIKE